MTEPDFLRELKVFEGYAEHMYQCSAGRVTIGIGIMLGTAAAAANSGVSFVDRTTKLAAKPTDIQNDFEAIRKAPPRMYPPARYKSYTRLDATSSSLNAVFNERLDRARADARAFYMGFDSLPSSAQWGLVDMAYNLGRRELCGYPKLRAALEQGKWELAASESKRKGIQPERNSAISGWFRKAGQEAAAGAPNPNACLTWGQPPDGLDPNLLAALAKAAKAYTATTRKPLVITSTVRTLRKQAEIMAGLTTAQLESLYCKNGYPNYIKSIVAAQQASGGRASADKVLEILSKRKEGFISAHLSGGAVDIASTGTDVTLLTDLLSQHGFDWIDERGQNIACIHASYRQTPKRVVVS